MDAHSLILIVEDNADDVELIRYAFTKAGIGNPIAAVEDGAQAIAYVQGKGAYADRTNHPCPGLVLLDLKLPRRSGFEVLEAIRRDEAMRQTPVVVLTSSTQDSDIRRAYEAGANSYLVKPVSRDRLLEMVKNLKAYWIDLNQTSPQ